MSSYLDKLGELLAFHGVISGVSQLTQANLKTHVTTFQKKKGLFADGDPGQNTLWALQKPFYGAKPKLGIEKIVVDPFSIPHIRLRSDAAALCREIKSAMDDVGARLTSDGGIRSLDDGANAHRSAKSMHYPGLAFDVAIQSGFWKPDTDPFVVVKNTSDSPYWVVYARAQGGSEMTLQATYGSGGWDKLKVQTKTVKGKFINFTELCRAHGFYPIGPRPLFLQPKDKQYLSSEWWHFQANDLLTPKISQFGIELLRLEGVTESRIQDENEAAWENRLSIFGSNWG